MAWMRCRLLPKQYCLPPASARPVRIVSWLLLYFVVNDCSPELSAHQSGQKKRNGWEDDQQQQRKNVHEYEPTYATENLVQLHKIAQRTLDHIHVQANRGRNQADFQQLDHDDAEPDEVHIKASQHRRDN